MDSENAEIQSYVDENEESEAFLNIDDESANIDNEEEDWGLAGIDAVDNSGEDWKWIRPTYQPSENPTIDLLSRLEDLKDTMFCKFKTIPTVYIDS